MSDIIQLSPESFQTLYLQAENGAILYTENGKRIVIKQIIPSEWVPYRIWDYENTINENKRNINLVDKRYVDQISKEFYNLMNP